MSVPTGQRNESTMMFLANARELVLYTLQKTKKWPQRWRHDVASPLVADARYIYTEVKRGNNIWPTNAYEAQMRRAHFLNARGAADGMVGNIEVACELVQKGDKVLHEWSALAANEIKYINGVLEKDKTRFRF